jgi:predicted ThiF/HesA family dinucleotide-utilizing enzyme
LVPDCRDGRDVAAQGTIGFSRQVELLEAHFQGIEKQEAIGQQFVFADDVFDRFRRLNGAEQARPGSDKAGLGTTGNRVRNRAVRSIKNK